MRPSERRRIGEPIVREMKFRPKIAGHDHAVKLKHIRRFLLNGDPVNVTVMFRGREVSFPELGERVLDQVRDAVSEIAIADPIKRPDERTMTMFLKPMKYPGHGDPAGVPAKVK